MKCITSPALDDIQIISYVEGEADDKTIAHIKKCPYCAERANTLTLFQKRMRARLYRSTCPSSMELGDYHMGLMSASQELVIAQHVRGCPQCRRDITELEKFLSVPDVQSDLAGKAKLLFAQLVGSGEAPTFGALRGTDGEPFIFQADNVRIVIDIQDDVEQMGLKTLVGLVTGLETNEFTIQVSQGEQMIATTSVDEIGNFIISHLTPGHYRLILSGPNMEIHIQSLPI